MVDDEQFDAVQDGAAVDPGSQHTEAVAAQTSTGLVYGRRRGTLPGVDCCVTVLLVKV